MRKDCEISVRITTQLKTSLEEIAEKRGESFAVIVREAIREYFSRRDYGSTVMNDAAANSVDSVAAASTQSALSALQSVPNKPLPGDKAQPARVIYHPAAKSQRRKPIPKNS